MANKIKVDLGLDSYKISMIDSFVSSISNVAS